MPSTCCVPGCRSNYKNTESVRVFKFPEKGTEQYECWLRKIPRKDWIPGNRTVVCVKHFREKDIVTHDELVEKDGKITNIPRLRWKLVADAAPCLFDNLPSYLSDPGPTVSRSSPTKRKEIYLEREQQKIDNFLNDDIVHSFEELVLNIKKIQRKDWLFHSTENKVTFYFLDTVNIPITVKNSITIEKDLKINIFLCNKKLTQEVKWLFKLKEKSIYLSRYSELENLFPWLENQVQEKDLTDIINDMKNFLSARDIETYNSLQFLYEQLVLLNSDKPRYSPQMLSWAFSFYILSPRTYRDIIKSDILRLPSERYLRRLSSVLSISSSCDAEEHLSYLKSKCDKLSSQDKYVNLLIDEISVRPHIDFGSSSLTGMSANKKSKRATSIQNFMICSTNSSYKDVAAMIPVCNSTADELLKWTKKVLEIIHNSGFVVETIITDNLRVNRNMLTNLCGGVLKSCISNIYIDGSYIFILFDTVHIIKSLRNNWINQRTKNCTLIFPSIKDFTNKMSASFSHLIDLYENEKSSVIKFAPKLSFKALNPNNFERQNVALCLRIFDSTNEVALKMSNKAELEGTIEFINTITQWWKMVNIKTPRKGFEHNDIFEVPFTSIDDPRLQYFDKIVEWLQAWKNYTLPYKGQRSGKLSEETFCSFLHTTKTLKELIIYNLNVLNKQYVLTGKYQTDPLEGRFGQYRQMHGGNYNISVEQVLKAEKKLRVKSLLELHSTKYGKFQLKEFLLEFTDSSSNETYETIELKGIDFFSFSEDEEAQIPIFIYISGYVVYKLKSRLECDSCCEMIMTDKKILFEMCGEKTEEFFSFVDRGNLTYPHNDIVQIFVVCYKIFTVLLSEEYEELLHLTKIKSVLQDMVIKKVEELDICSEENCKVCNLSKLDLGKKCVSIFLNIFLNNYAIKKNDYFASCKGFKRKYSILSSAAE